MIQTVPPQLRQRNLIFHENWESTSKVISNGGTITSTPLVTKGKFTGNGSAYITYPTSINNRISGASALTIIIKKVIVPTSAVVTQTVFGNWQTGGTAGSVLIQYQTNGLYGWDKNNAYGYFSVSNNEAIGDVAFVYDGSQTGNNKLMCYVNGVTKTLTYNGTHPTTLSTATCAPIVGSYGDSTTKLGAGGSFGEILIFNTALTATEVNDLYTNGSTYSVSGK